MPSVIIAGGGLAGLAAATALGQAGFRVDLLEARAFLGGRATSWPENGEVIDNCQHVLLRCCVNLLDFYRRLGVADRIAFHDTFHFIEPGGRVSVLRRGSLAAPLHFAGSFLRMPCLGAADKLGIARGLLAIRRERRRTGLDRIGMLDWLLAHRQTPRAIERFWRQVLVSAVNEDLDRMAACHGFQVFWLGFLAHPDAYEMGIPAVPLRELYCDAAFERAGQIALHMRSAAKRFEFADGRAQAVLAGGERLTADYFICALPFERVSAVAPELEVPADLFEHSPITGIHLWYDRPVTALPHATLLDRTLQWVFNKRDGRYLLAVVSASRDLVEASRSDVLAIAQAEMAEFFPAAREARLVKAQVVKEVRATFSAAPETEARRPPAATRFPNLFLAGDWTRSGWPATMEGAVRSGYLAAEAVAAAAGRPSGFVVPGLVP